jgi:hypothetical protein
MDQVPSEVAKKAFNIVVKSRDSGDLFSWRGAYARKQWWFGGVGECIG